MNPVIFIVVTFCALFGVESTSTTHSRLLADLRAINNLILREDLVHIIEDYSENDSQVKEIAKYFKGNEVHSVLVEFYDKPQVKEFMKWFLGKLPPPSEYDGSFVSIFPESDMFSEQVPYDKSMTGGWNGLIHDYFNAFPKEEFLYLVEKIKESDPDFVEMLNRLSSLKPVYEEFIKEPQVIEVGKKLQSLGVNVQRMDKFIRHIYGWN